MNTIIKKICSDCKDEKNIDLFTYNKSRERYSSVCKKCNSLRTQKYHKENPEKWKNYDKTTNEKVKNIILEFKKSGCIKCNEKRDYVLDCHHIDSSQKEFSIGTTRQSISKLQKELKKCIPLCSNCHREFHYLERQNDITIMQYIKITKVVLG